MNQHPLRPIWILSVLVGAVVSVTLAAGAEIFKEPIPVAAIFSVTGPAAEANAPSILGVRFAVDEINQSGGIGGRPLNLLLLDNRSTPIGSKVAADQAVAARVAAIIGASWSSHSIAVAQVAQAAKIPMISNISTNARVTEIGDYIFRACFIDPFQGLVMARFARLDLKAETAAVMIDITSDYSMGLAQEFARNFTRQGGRISKEFNYKQKQEEFSAELTEIKLQSPDVLFIPGHDESGRIVKQAREAGIDTVFLGGDGWDAVSFLENGGNTLGLGYYCTHWSPQVDNPTSRRFVARYGEITDLNANTALGYDAVYLLADAIGRAGSLDGAKIRDALAATRNFQGVTGIINLEQNGNPVKSAVIMKIEQGKPSFLKLVSP